MSTDFDPTAIELQTDPLRRRFVGVAAHGHTPFDVPFVSKITDNLYQGGCESGLVLPGNIRHVVSLYPWERYITPLVIDSELYVKMYDSSDVPDRDQLVSLARYVNERRATGATLVHCQAGLNRSSLVAGLALVLDGMQPAEAIAYLREARSPAVLCNRAFEQWLLDYDPADDD